MDTQILAALLTVGLTVVAAFVGFLYREYRNRVQPFMAITKVESDMRQIDSEVASPASIGIPLKDAFFITKLDSSDKMRKIVTAFREARIFLHTGPIFVRTLDKLIAAAESGNVDEFQNSLAKVFLGKFEDEWDPA